jgi:ketosteroid isomerase-like protein
MTTPAENLATVRKVYEAFGRGDVDTIADNASDDVDWATEASLDGAPWWGVRRGKEGLRSFFDDFAKVMEPQEFVPVAMAADGDEVLTVVRFVVRARETGKTARMDLHHWFRFRDGKIAYYRGTEDTLQTVVTLTT